MTFDIPLLGSVACGAPIYAEENIEAYIPVSTKIASIALIPHSNNDKHKPILLQEDFLIQ